MNYKITYLVNGVLKEISDLENEDLKIDLISNKRISLSVTPKKKITLKSALIKMEYQFSKNTLIFANGYQSWTDTKEFYASESLHDVMKRLKFLVDMFSFDRYGDAHFKKYNKDIIHAFDIGYIKGNIELLIASYNYMNSYLIINFNKKTNEILLESDIEGLEIDSRFTVFDYLLYGNVELGLKEYFSSFKLKKNEKIFGYTSWYNHYQNINEKIIMDNLDSIDSRFNLFQIDDGYETFVGDWLNIDKNKFPNGLKEIVYKIHDKNLKAGIWLAPFVAEEKSELFQNHKEYFLKNSDGTYAKGGSNWSGFYGLDFYNEEARAYIKKSLEYYLEMGFDFFKLDFLYGISLVKRNDKTRAMIAEEAYQFLRDVLKDKLILGCGAVISNSFLKFDYLRIGPDVSLKFDDVWYMKYMHRERISTKVTLQNTIYRSIFNNKVFGCDPDVFLLRDDNISLSSKQKYALLVINSLFGNVLMTSDNIKNYDDDKEKLLNLAFKIQKDAKVLNVKRVKNYIEISYKLMDNNYKITYNCKKGVIENGR